MTQCSGLGTSGWHHSQLLLGLELLLQGGSKHLLTGDRDFIIFSFLGVGEEVAQGGKGLVGSSLQREAGAAKQVFQPGDSLKISHSSTDFTFSPHYARRL